MVCYHPIECFYPVVKDSDDKRRLIFNEDTVKKYAYFDLPFIRNKCLPEVIEGYKIKVPCGKCIGCRLDYSRMWATRAVHESMLHKDNTFVTLTFNDEHLPEDFSLNKGMLSSWLKRFRRRFGEGIRFMACGEYGEKFHRPHYHLILFNFKFPDQKYWTTRHGQIYYRSNMLEDIWREPHQSESCGYSVIGDVSYESAAYVARYVTKKFDGPLGESKYNGREKEFLLMSRMPGLGHDFIVKNYKHILNNGFVVLPSGHKAPIPRYYIDTVKDIDEDCYNRYKLDRENFLYNNLFNPDINSTQERLLVREELQKQKLDKLVRCYEFDANLHNIY